VFEEMPKQRKTSTLVLVIELLVVLGALTDLSKHLHSAFDFAKIAELSVIVAGVAAIIAGLRERKS